MTSSNEGTERTTDGDKNSAKDAPQTAIVPPSNSQKKDHSEHKSHKQKHPLDIAEFIFVVAAACAAVYAAISTHQQVTISKDTERRQLRAYIHVEPIALVNFGINQEPTVTVKIKNIGLTPAYNVTSHVWVHTYPFPFPATQNFPEGAIVEEEAGSRGIFDPGIEELSGQTSTEILTAEKMDSILRGTQHLYVSVKVEYRDSFGVECERRFLFHVGGSGLVESIEQNGKNGIIWGYSNRYDDVNDECE